MPPGRNMNINDVYERIMARIEERLYQFVDQFANRMNDMMNPRRRGDRNGPPVFDDDQYEEEIMSVDVGKGFVDNYPNFQEDKNNVSFSGVALGLKEESMPVYDTDIEDVIDGEEDDMEDVVVVANDLCSSKIQTTVSVNFSKTIDSNHQELILLKKGNFVEVSNLIGKKYQEEYLKAAPMDDKLGFKTIKVRGRVIIMKGNLMQGIQMWMLRVKGTSEASSRTSFFQVGGENDAVVPSYAETLTFSQKLNYLLSLFI
ncbi:hypothetical protein Tco_1303347 [Tanacetum coccineum]